MTVSRQSTVIYLDHNATTPVRPEVIEAVRLASGAGYGNPSSIHGPGRLARSALEESRERIALRLGVRPSEIVFTSGGTEANRIAIAGALAEWRPRGLSRSHAVVSAIEHPSTLELYAQLAREEGLAVDRVPAGPEGRVDPGAIEEAIRPETAVVSLLHANNETGVIQDVAPVARSCRARGIPFHCDAVQSLGKIPLEPAELGADLVSLSAHKIGGPKGAGALWIRPGCRFRAPFLGGPQERGIRPGTENLPGSAGFACAVERMELRGPDLRDRFLDALHAKVPEAVLNGNPEWLLPNTLNLSFPGISAELLLIGMDLEGVAASSGSACASGSREPSHVLLAMGLSRERIESSVRFSLGWTSTPEEVDRAVEVISRVVESLRSSRRSPPAGGASPRSGPGTYPIDRGTPLSGP